MTCFDLMLLYLSINETELICEKTENILILQPSIVRWRAWGWRWWRWWWWLTHLTVSSMPTVTTSHPQSFIAASPPTSGPGEGQDRTDWHQNITEYSQIFSNWSWCLSKFTSPGLITKLQSIPLSAPWVLWCGGWRPHNLHWGGGMLGMFKWPISTCQLFIKFSLNNKSTDMRPSETSN